MTNLQLSSKTRTDFRKSETKRLRREGEVPATVYGKGFDPHAVTVSADAVNDLLKAPGGRLSLIDLSVDGQESAGHPVMIQNMQIDAITKQIIHIDFHRVSMDEPVHATVPIVLVGDAPGIKQGGLLEQFTASLDIKALPDHIPTHIDVDVSGLELGQNIHVGDVKVTSDIEVLGPVADSVVATVRIPTVRAEEPSAAEEATEAAAEEAPAE